MAKSDSRFGYQAKLGRTDFDLSRRFGFSSTAGSLLPIWFDLASPGDSYYMQHNLPLLRSCNLAAPAMVDVKVHFETFFVPMQMIYQPFEQTMFSLKDLQSSNYGTDLLNNSFPLFDYGKYVETIIAGTTSSIRQQAFRLADLLGLNAANFASKKYAPSFFPYQICAYHAIWQYYYRLDDKSIFYNGYFNLDRFYNTSTFEMDSDFMGLHQRPWDFDYFSSIYRSPIVSDANMQNILPKDYYSPLNGYISAGGTSTAPVGVAGSINVSSNNDIFKFSSAEVASTNGRQSMIATAAIRQMFANEKLAMITGRTKKNYDSQVLAHYGVNVPHDVKHDITMVHHDTYDLNVQEVTSLANTSDGALGELAGKSYAAGHGEKFKFTAPCHGVLMTIFSVEPRRNYLGAFDRINAVTNAYDLPTPEFDRLGNVPMYLYECSVNSTVNPYTGIIGWKERYYQYKRKYNRCTLGFGSATAVAPSYVQSVNSYSAYFIADVPFTNNPSIPSSAAQTRPSDESSFYINPNAMDNLTYVPYLSVWQESDSENWSNTPWLVYARDPFIVDSNITCTKVSWMSKDGEPVYD